MSASQTTQLNELYRACNKLTYEIEGAINDLYCGRQSASSSTEQSPILNKIAYLNQKLSQLQNMYENANIQGGHWKEKIDRLMANADSLPQNYQVASRRNMRENAPYSRQMAGQDSDQSIRQQYGNENLQRSQSSAEDIIRDGQSILHDLQSQKDQLQQIRSKSLQILQQLGVSDSILGMMSQRGRCDLIIFFFMAIFTLIAMYVLLYYVKPWLFG